MKTAYESLEDITTHNLNSCNTKKTFVEKYNDMKLMRASVQLDIAELEKNILIAKQKADSDHYRSQARPNKMKENILELSLKTNKKEI